MNKFTNYILYLTLAGMIIRPLSINSPLVEIGLQLDFAWFGLCLAVLIGVIKNKKILYHPLLWSAYAAIMWINILWWWYPQDNHQWLWALWVTAIAIFCTINVRQGMSVAYSYLRSVAYILIAWIMIVAVFQKLLMGQYWDHSFFGFTYLTDYRFSEHLALLTDYETRFTVENNAALQKGFTIANDPESLVVKLQGYQEVLPLAVFSSFWINGIELLVGILALIAWRYRTHEHMFHSSMYVFLVTTYTVAYVGGFAWLLTLLSLATLKEKPRSIFVVLYLVFFIYVTVFSIAIDNPILTLSF